MFPFLYLHSCYKFCNLTILEEPVSALRLALRLRFCTRAKALVQNRSLLASLLAETGSSNIVRVQNLYHSCRYKKGNMEYPIYIHTFDKVNITRYTCGFKIWPVFWMQPQPPQSREPISRYTDSTSVLLRIVKINIYSSFFGTNQVL